MKQRTVLSATFVTLIAFAAACGPTATAAPTGTGSDAGIANPASVFCEQNAGRLDIRTGPDGGQIGVCVFPDASECEEWAYFRGECAPGSVGAPTIAAPLPAEPVTLQVLLPQDGSLIEIEQCQVIGTTSPGAVVTVNDEILIAGPDGSFQTTVALEAGVNLIEVVVSNLSGSEAFVYLTVTYQP